MSGMIQTHYYPHPFPNCKGEQLQLLSCKDPISKHSFPLTSCPKYPHMVIGTMFALQRGNTSKSWKIPFNRAGKRFRLDYSPRHHRAFNTLSKSTLHFASICCQYPLAVVPKDTQTGFLPECRRLQFGLRKYSPRISHVFLMSKMSWAW